MKLAAVSWKSEYVDQGQVVFRVGVQDDLVIAEWTGLAVLTAARDGSSSTLTFAADASAEDRRKIERGSARLLVRHLQRKLALHGAALELDGHAVVLLGRSGQGKSTLAALLCRAGWSLLADDSVALDPSPDGSWLVRPSEEDHWLDIRTREMLGESSIHRDDIAKWPVRAPRIATGPAVLVALVEIVNDPAASTVLLSRTSGITALASVVPQAVRFLLDDDARNASELDTLASLVDRVSTYTLHRKLGYALLPAAVDALQTLVRGPDA